MQAQFHRLRKYNDVQFTSVDL